MTGRSVSTKLSRTCVIALTAATMVGTGGMASAGSNEYPPSASIDPIAPTSTALVDGTIVTTGSDSTRSGILLGVGALGLGGGLVAVARRRRDASASA